MTSWAVPEDQKLPTCVADIANASRLTDDDILPRLFPNEMASRIDERGLLERKHGREESDIHWVVSAAECEILALTDSSPKLLPNTVTLTDPVIAELALIRQDREGMSAEYASEDEAD